MKLRCLFGNHRRVIQKFMISYVGTVCYIDRCSRCGSTRFMREGRLSSNRNEALMWLESQPGFSTLIAKEEKYSDGEHIDHLSLAAQMEDLLTRRPSMGTGPLPMLSLKASRPPDPLGESGHK